MSVDSRISFFLFSVLFGSVTHVAFAQSSADQELVERIRPVGEVCIQGNDCTRRTAAAETPVDQPASDESSAESAVGQSSAPETSTEVPASTAEAKVDAAVSSRTGKEIYDRSCFACHGAGVAGAPKKGVASDWEPRLAQGRAALLDNALNGMAAMPPKGTCMDCSQQELDSAIEYMLGGNP